MESIHVNFDELPQMASNHIFFDPAPECQRMALEHDSLSHANQRQANVPQADKTVTTSNELDLLFSLMFDELLNGSSKVVSKSFAVCFADAPNQRQHHTTPLNNHTTPAPKCQVPSLAPTVSSSENINQAETYAENDQVADNEFSTYSVPRFKTKGRQQVIGHPSQSVRTRRQLESDAKMCMFALTMSQTKPKNIKEDMADSAWIESMQEELHQYHSHGSLVSERHRFRTNCFSDSNHAGFLDSCKSTSGGIQFLGGDKLLSWSSKKQDCTSMSFAEAEYVSLSACCAQVLWMRTQLTDYGFHFDKIPMYCDSKVAIAISCNPVQHLRTKHFDVRYHFIKEKVEKGIVELFFVRAEYQLADLFTKALPEEMFKYLVRRLGMRCLTPAELEALENDSA
nr:retrovirus-related Pol polyprotein from transposon TNT 1-94 [Tanacetum cinerariifolium]